MTTNKQYKIKALLGDYYNDGHGRYQEFVLNCTHSMENIRKAYVFTYKKCGFNLNDHFEGYEQHKAHISVFPEFLQVHIRDVWDDQDDEIYLDPEKYLELYLLMVKQHLANFEYTWAKDLPTLDVGGYGLF